MSPSRKPKQTGKLTELDRMKGPNYYNAKPPHRVRSTIFSCGARRDGAALPKGDGFKILMFIWDFSLGRLVEEKEPFYEVTEPILPRRSLRSVRVLR